MTAHRKSIIRPFVSTIHSLRWWLDVDGKNHFTFQLTISGEGLLFVSRPSTSANAGPALHNLQISRRAGRSRPNRCHPLEDFFANAATIVAAGRVYPIQ